MATYNCHWLIMGKNENWHLLLSHCRFFDKTFTEMFLEWSSTNHMNFVQLLNLIGCHGNWNAKFAKKYSKILSSEAIRGMKLKLCRNVHNISLYKKYVFYCHCSCAFVAMPTYNFHRLIMGKVKVGLYLYLTVDILTKVFRKCSLSSPLPNTWILSKSLYLIGCHGNRKDKFAKKY